MNHSEMPVIVIGAGGHAKVLISTLLLCRRNIVGFVDLNSNAHPVFGIRCLGSDSEVLRCKPDDVVLANGVGSIGSTANRRDVYERFTREHFRFVTVIHPSAIVARETQIDEGVQIMAGAIVQPGCRLDTNSILNTGCRVDHDCVIGSHVHIAPGVTLSGNVQIGAGAHIGSGAAIIQGIHIGTESIVGAGSVVLRDVLPHMKVVGVPAVSKAKREATR